MTLPHDVWLPIAITQNEDIKLIFISSLLPYVTNYLVNN